MTGFCYPELILKALTAPGYKSQCLQMEKLKRKKKIWRDYFTDVKLKTLFSIAINAAKRASMFFLNLSIYTMLSRC